MRILYFFILFLLPLGGLESAFGASKGGKNNRPQSALQKTKAPKKQPKKKVNATSPKNKNQKKTRKEGEKKEKKTEQVTSKEDKITEENREKNPQPEGEITEENAEKNIQGEGEITEESLKENTQGEGKITQESVKENTQEEGEVVQEPTQEPALIEEVPKENTIWDMNALVGFLLDLIILLFLLLSAFFGYKHGVLSHLVTLLCGISPFGVWYFFSNGNNIATWIKKEAPLLKDIAPLIQLGIILACYLLFFKILSNSLHYLFRKTILVHFDNIVGAFVYSLLCAIIISIVIKLLDGQNIKIPKDYTSNMYLYEQIEGIYDGLSEFIKTHRPYLNQLLQAKKKNKP